MQISKFTDYAFRSLIYLARNRDETATVDKLAKYLEVSEHHMKKVIHKLAKTGYIISTKGRNGGLKLGLEPSEINLGKVLVATEENLNLVECMANPKLCPLMTNNCNLKGILSKSLQAFINELSKYTLEDIL
ncbi:Rrf2 family transcriptional regulator [Clostridium bornimense]|uniref:RrF2 family transcriptional regulator n=1 Tax=Clostridium bornimense TaxID=1216932 RepID=UPI001C10B9A8|nr:Rrf2 family transcriptional regulator [Clostridium bornimense]MBU5315455.1 Rrf2 family transcriptional regulator [Clostridium bornimense]